MLTSTGAPPPLLIVHYPIVHLCALEMYNGGRACFFCLGGGRAESLLKWGFADLVRRKFNLLTCEVLQRARNAPLRVSRPATRIMGTVTSTGSAASAARIPFVLLGLPVPVATKAFLDADSCLSSASCTLQRPQRCRSCMSPVSCLSEIEHANGRLSLFLQKPSAARTRLVKLVELQQALN